MEYWTLFNNSNASSTNNIVRGQNGHFPHPPAWDLTSTSNPPYPPQSAAATMLHDGENSGGGGGHSCSSTTTCSSLYCNPDPHLTCLKLGKRHYFEDMTPPAAAVGKKCKSHVNASSTGADAATPKCQVEGCGSLLVNAKDYHRRHKVCEMHAKAPKVLLLGIDQRFCQQCSRFHALAEFDEAKRSCRRRLAGHNERRRKSSQEHNSIARKHYHDIKLMVAGGHPPPHLLGNAEYALSLLSPTNYSPHHAATTSYDLPMSCSAALRDLIAENRASAGNHNAYRLGPSWAVENRAHVTLDLMQDQESGFGPGQDRRLSEEDGDGDCAEFWNLPLGY